jgi:hypothetical protein
MSSSSSKLTVQNYQILQKSIESPSTLSHNYHTIDLVAGQLSQVQIDKLMLALNVDRSGSMESKAKDGHSSLQHTIHTTKNIIDYLGELKEETPTLRLSILVNAFDDKNTMIGCLEIGDKDTDDFIKKLEKLKPRGTTNISGAFEKIKENEQYCSAGNKAHILMTDGQPNAGKTSAEGIVENSPGGKQIMIGYGTGHDATLLQKMAELTDGSYHFVESIENAGMVYGEIIHGLLYVAVKDINVTVKGAEVYDFTKNEWGKSVKFTSFASEHTQSLILRSEWDSVEPVSIKRQWGEDDSTRGRADVFTSYNCTDGESKESGRNVGVEKQMFRQKAMDALFRANTSHDEKATLSAELLKLQTELKEFMVKNNLDDDAFMQKLVTDVYVAYKGIYSQNGAAFIGSRLAAQGNQQAYDINNFDGLNDDEDLADSIFGVAGGGFECMRHGSQQESMAAPRANALRQTSCYATPTQTMVMRTCSQQPHKN